MEAFRTLIRGWFGKLLLILFLTPFAFIGIEGYFSGGSKADVVKVVNGQEISKKELENRVKLYNSQLLKDNKVNGDETLLNQPFIENLALEDLISLTLLTQQAINLGLGLSDAQISQMLAQQPTFQENGKFSQARFEQYLRGNGLSKQALINDLRKDHAYNMLAAGIAQNALVNNIDVQQFLNLQTEKRDLFLAKVQLDDYKQKVKVSAQEVQDYYNKHQAQYKQAARVDVDYVVVQPAMLAAQVTPVTEQELQQAYQQYVAEAKKNQQYDVKQLLISLDQHDNDPAKAKKVADEVYAKIQAGLSFAEAVKQYSEDSLSKTEGGKINYTAGAFGAAFDQAVLSSQDKVTAPVKTDYGYHLIVAKAQASQVASFEAEKARLSAEVQQTKSDNLFRDTVNKLNELVVDNDALDVVTQQVKAARIDTVKDFTLFTQHPVLSDPAVKVKLFNEDVVNGDRNASSNIQVGPQGDIVWVKVRQYYPSKVQDLAQVKAKVQAKLIEKKAYEAAKKDLQQSLAAFKSQPAQQALATSKLNFEHIGIRNRGQVTLEVQRVAFSLPQPAAGKWSVDTVALDNDLIVVAVADVQKDDINKLPAEVLKQQKAFYEGLRGQQLLNDYAEYLKSKAKIK
ncbi:SurA N-terminal domain-containing protein [Acinetobacter larvae]|uniref:Periplasmic chaperone PpiD n=1 Tax=Acinetobacter larvae TaxID=1789224 RepID=A0A1B2LYW2_9GAMM|nr:SurA N-terminal domain-containing protein [Acinetobacter larvae]AOA58134.1 peptidylprolyl isomerase [Acinetobacter larvae]